MSEIEKYKSILNDAIIENCDKLFIGDKAIEEVLKMHETVILNKYNVMRSIIEIEERLSVAESELEYHKEWLDKANKSYISQRTYWGDADDGEIRTAQEAVHYSSKEVIILKWVLGHP